MSVDLRCYFVTGGADHRRSVAVARSAAAGGAGVIQVRSKPVSDRDLTSLTTEIAREVAAVNPGTRVLVDDRVEVAVDLIRRGVPVHGVHLGSSDMPVPQARALLGRGPLIGLTTGTLELVQAAAAFSRELDYIGAGPFRPTPTKNSGRAPLGLMGYPPLVAASPVPVVAIGDVTPEDAGPLAATGVAGVAICRGFMQATEPEAVARAVLAGFGDGK